MQFEDLPLNEDLLDALYDMRFENCTPVQEQCIPPILDGRDVIGIAQTGTGKTAAYLLPVLTLLKEKAHDPSAVNCLVIAPTRELARQIDQALQGFAYYMDINGVAIYGGNDGIRYEQERRSLSTGADIVVATPGRLITHLSLGSADFSRTTHLILDEADRMLDMGFYEDIMTIVKAMPDDRQTILFSATMPPKIAELARGIMNNPVEVSIAVSKPAEGIRQSVYLCREADKTRIIEHIFTLTKPERVIIFAGSKLKVKELNISLKRAGYNVEAMHSDLEQPERDRVMAGFKARQIDILVATDIVARGIDIDDITLVVNFDAPRDAEDYVHRVGRTARAGREGRAVTLVGEKDRIHLRDIEKLLEAEIPREELPEGCVAPSPFAPSREGHGGGRSGHGGRQRGGKGRGGRRGGSRKEMAPTKATASSASDETTPALSAATAASGNLSAEGEKPRRRKHRGGRRRGGKGRSRDAGTDVQPTPAPSEA
ncbi:MAG: DEAD/DEAH box helicase [Prevotellaceae bacterium]|nr:DEAD/DEAH box helicase [Prevotellaceae bacterium]